MPEFASREALTGADARTLAHELLAMTQEEFSAAFKGSPMKRAKLRGLKRNSAVVLGNIGTRHMGSRGCPSSLTSLVPNQFRGVLGWPRAGAARAVGFQAIKDKALQPAESAEGADGVGALRVRQYPSAPGHLVVPNGAGGVEPIRGGRRRRAYPRGCGRTRG